MTDQDSRPRFARRGLLGAAVAAVGAAGCQTAARADPVASAPSSAPIMSADGVLHMPPRDIPLPPSISPQARAYLTLLGRAPATAGDGAPPALDDAAGWRARIAKADANVERFIASAAAAARASAETQTVGGVTVYVAARDEASAAERRKIHLYIHGGGWTLSGGRLAMMMGQLAARSYGGTVYSVDYRMPPDHPYPAPLDDCLAVYRLTNWPGATRRLRSMVSGDPRKDLSAALMLRAR